MNKSQLAVQAIVNRISNDPRVAYLLGPGSQSFDEITAAFAELVDRDVEEFRRTFAADLTFEPWPSIAAAECASCAPQPQPPREPDSWEEVAARIAVLRETARDDFIGATIATRAFDEDARPGYFIMTLEGVFSSRPLEMGFMGYCLGRALQPESGRI